MLRHGLAKVAAAGLGARVQLVRGDATALPVADGSVDAVTIAFGIRNVQDTAAACRELVRVLRPGGRVAILEFGLPSVPGLKQLYGWYFLTRAAAHRPPGVEPSRRLLVPAGLGRGVPVGPGLRRRAHARGPRRGRRAGH